MSSSFGYEDGSRVGESLRQVSLEKEPALPRCDFELSLNFRHTVAYPLPLSQPVDSSAGRDSVPTSRAEDEWVDLYIR